MLSAPDLLILKAINSNQARWAIAMRISANLVGDVFAKIGLYPEQPSPRCSDRRGFFLTAKTTTLPSSKSFVYVPPKPLHGAFVKAALVFCLSYIVLFIGMNLSPNLYDESIILTGAMRVATGQIPHQDFYTNYGPGQFYTVAALFKFFGQSVIVERLYDLFLRALIVSLIYIIASSWCRQSIAIWTTIVSFLWLFGIDQIVGTAVIPVSLLNLVAVILILPVFSRPLPAKRMLAAGVVAGIASLFRYDTGIALFGIEACVVAIAIVLRTTGIANRLRNFVVELWPCLLGFATVTLATLGYYLSRAPIYPFVHDILIYPSKYYHRGRNLPFPAINLKGLDNIGIYLPVAIIAISLYVVFATRSRTQDKDASDSYDHTVSQPWHGFLITLSLLTLVMYLKGFVRVSLIQTYLAILPSVLLVAVLFQHRDSLTRPLRTSIKFLAVLSIVVACLASLREVWILFRSHKSIPEHAWRYSTGNLSEVQATWCNIKGPVTRGLCFLPDNDHIRAIEFIESHTQPGQKLFVGQTRHDIMFANDNFTYFATQRLPATRWSHFDPFLQNTYSVQTQMIAELDANTPPYIVLDSEFDGIHEHNDSSKSTGVTALDEYIHSKYRRVQTYGEMSIWSRMQTP